MKISIIIPVYNGEAFLEECLQSVMGQIYGDFETIIVNDGSSDSTLQIAKRFAERDSRVKILTTPNRGVSAARNSGIKVAEGEFVTFVDSDDCLYSKALEILSQTARRYDADVVVSPLVKGEAFEELYYNSPKVEIYDYPEAMRVSLYQKRIMNSPCGTLIRRALLERGEEFREGIRYEDLDAYYRFFSPARTIVYISQPLYFYRGNPDSFMNSWSERRLDVLDVTDRMVAFFEREYPEIVRAARDRRFSAHYDMLVRMIRGNVDNAEAMERCWRVIREERGRTLRNPEVRLKNKLGALASYFGKGLIRLLAR